MTAADRLAAIDARSSTAYAELARLCKDGWSKGFSEAWRWSIPAQPERDSDLLLDASLTDVPVLVAAVQAVLALHARVENEDDPESPWCDHCSEDREEWSLMAYPCATVRAIEEALS